MAAPAETQLSYEITSEVTELRLLTEVDHLIAAKQMDGSIDPAIKRDLLLNFKTAVYEMSMPYGVSTGIHRAEYIEDEAGRQRRKFIWMGKCLVENAINGGSFHKAAFTKPRMASEIASAEDIQENLSDGIAKIFISPKATSGDAPADLASAEHLFSDDSLRVSYPVVDNDGEIIAHKLQALLVRDVPIQAWAAMLRDPNNIFGQAFDVDESSALPIMQLFQQFDLPVAKIPEGPITLVAEVQKYIKDNAAYDSVGIQLREFRQNQQQYEEQAEFAAHEWYLFEDQLAESLITGEATRNIRAFIIGLQDNWNNDHLAILEQHATGNTGYAMTRQLAAMLESAKRNLVRAKAAIAVKNDQVMRQLPQQEAQTLQAKIVSAQIAFTNGLISNYEYQRIQTTLDQQLAGKNIKGGGGCIGNANANFRDPNNPNNFEPGLAGNGNVNEGESSDWENGKRKWKTGVCEVKSCPTRPGKTDVGPCNVCKLCQNIYDNGGDPTKDRPQPKPMVKFSIMDHVKFIPGLENELNEKSKSKSFSQPQKLAQLALSTQ